MTTHQSSTASQSLMDRKPTTPNASVPHLTEPIDDEFEVRISSGAAGDGALERDSQGEWVGRLRRLSAAKLRSWGLESLSGDATLLVSELLTNALRYGEGRKIDFRLVITDQLLVITVNDGSPRRPELSVVGTDRTTGRGLFIVAAFADDWGVSPDGTTTWCTLRTRGAR